MWSFRLAFLLFVFFMNNACATMFYRHLPVSMPLDKESTLIVEYDDTQQRGVWCRTQRRQAWIAFAYKGHQKIAPLPVLLQNTVPKKPNEMLADASGFFSIMIDKQKSANGKAHVQCDYATSLPPS